MEALATSNSFPSFFYSATKPKATQKPHNLVDINLNDITHISENSIVNIRVTGKKIIDIKDFELVNTFYKDSFENRITIANYINFESYFSSIDIYIEEMKAKEAAIIMNAFILKRNSIIKVTNLISGSFFLIFMFILIQFKADILLFLYAVASFALIPLTLEGLKKFYEFRGL